MILKNKKYGMLDILNIAYKCSPLYSILIALNIILVGIIPTLQVYVTAQFIDTATKVANEHLLISTVYPAIIFLVLLIGFSWLSSNLNKLWTAKLTLYLKEKFRVAIIDKTAKLNYKHIENHNTWDLIARVSKEPEIIISDAYNNILGIISLFIRVIGLIVILITQAWWAAIIIVTISVPLFYIAVKSGKANYNASRDITKYNRHCDYLTQIMTDRETVHERTLFGFSKKLNDTWQKKYQKAQKIEISTSIKWLIKMRYGSLITAAISLIIIIILINPLVNGLLSLGMFIALVNATFSLVTLMSWQLTTSFDNLTRHLEYMNDLSDFLSLSESQYTDSLPSSQVPVFDSLEFIGVSFRYPCTDTYILNNLSFKIERGKHYAFVGINGAGKTTITKLITGLYDDYEGEILLNGKSIKYYSKKELKLFYSVVYQDFVRYSISIKNNVLLGNTYSLYESTTCENKIIDILDSLDIYDVLSRLPSGIDTPLGKILPNSVDLSTGQWQRIAIARAVINPAPFRILDEPTAALDPISESLLYEKFEQISKDKTTLFISHRLGSTKLADVIFVLDNGALVESGSHDELMDGQGIYSMMFHAQRSWYHEKS